MDVTAELNSIPACVSHVLLGAQHVALSGGRSCGCSRPRQEEMAGGSEPGWAVEGERGTCEQPLTM